MYIFPEMIELGLKEEESFPSELHRQVAQIIGICNPNVTKRDTLQNIVTTINSVPIDRIKTITYKELIKKFNLPDVGIYK